jgi:hypothetical protein
LHDKTQRKKYIFFFALYSSKAKEKAATLGPFSSYYAVKIVTVFKFHFSSNDKASTQA